MTSSSFRHILASRANRREFVAESLRGAAALIALGTLPGRRDDAPWHARAYPFTLGIASGDPAPDGFVAWTRLAPDPLRGGGMPARPVTVGWEVAADDSFRRIIQRGEARALPELAHSVHAEIDGLSPAREYFYRFIAGGEVSPIGRALTAPALGAPHNELRFAIVSCQHFEHGYYTAYRHLAADNVDLVVHLGDYIYEGGIASNPSLTVRRHEGAEVMTLEQYRNRYALYQTDTDLQHVHAVAPFIVTWDDHEVANNYANDVSADNTPREVFLARRAAAYQAYYEHLPLRRPSLPSGAAMRLYRRVPFGTLATFNVLDTRQYRSDQACGDGRKPRCPEVHDDRRTLLGSEQEKWLLDGLAGSQSRWNFLANQVVMGDNASRRADGARTFALDTWNGYVAQRQRILNFLGTQKPSNPVVLTGDIHVSLALDLRADWDKPAAPTVGVELVATSISSGGDGRQVTDYGQDMLSSNAHMKFFDGRRGYLRVNVSRQRLTADYRVVPVISRLGGPVETVKSFVVEDGKPQLQQA